MPRIPLLYLVNAARRTILRTVPLLLFFGTHLPYIIYPSFTLILINTSSLTLESSSRLVSFTYIAFFILID